MNRRRGDVVMLEVCLTRRTETATILPRFVDYLEE